MRNGILCSIASVLASAGIAFGDGTPTLQLPSAIPQRTAAATAAEPAATQPVKSADGLEAGDSCPGICQSWNDNPCPRERLWIGADYLLWWVKSAHYPPLVTTGNPNDIVGSGAIGVPGTSVLFGDSVGQDVFSGGRFTAGYWLTDDHSFGIDAGFFFLGRQSNDFQASSTGSSVLALPFLDLGGFEDRTLLAFPGLASGSVSASVSSKLWGTDLNLRREIWRGESSSVQVLAGFRHLELDERLDMFSQSTVLPTVPVIGGFSDTTADHVSARNYFYGGQVGAVADFRRGAFSLALTSKVALGSTHQIANLNGTSTESFMGNTATFANGAWVFASNGGRHTHDEFSVVPEAGLNLGYQVTKSLRATIGYTLIYWSDVLRPGDTLDRTHTPPTTPVFIQHSSDFWAQGLNFGVEFRY